MATAANDLSTLICRFTSALNRLRLFGHDFYANLSLRCTGNVLTVICAISALPLLIARRAGAAKCCATFSVAPAAIYGYCAIERLCCSPLRRPDFNRAAGCAAAPDAPVLLFTRRARSLPATSTYNASNAAITCFPIRRTNHL